MAYRAERIASWLAPHLPARGRVADVGAGTGHNARALARRTALTITEIDVVDMHAVGAGPLLFDGSALPFADGSFAAALLLFVLQYSPDPARLLREVGRVTAGPLLVLQSTCAAGPPGQVLLGASEALWGPVAFTVARAARLITAERCALLPRRLFTRPLLQGVFAAAGFDGRLARSAPWPLPTIRDDLFVLMSNQEEGAALP